MLSRRAWNSASVRSLGSKTKTFIIFFKLSMLGSRYRPLSSLMPSVGIGTKALAPPVPPPISTSLPTRSGQLRAKATALWPPMELPTRCTRSRSSWSTRPLRTSALRSEREPSQTIESLLLQPGQSSRITRKPALTSGSMLRLKLAQPLAPGPEPWSITTVSRALPGPQSL
ncbi:hypothetical protein D9M69_223600 [compost metagenome]